MTAAELQYKIEIGVTVEFVHEGQKRFIQGEKEGRELRVRFGKDGEAGQKYDSFRHFMAEAMVGNHWLREFIEGI